MKLVYSIEFGHIYIDEALGKEHLDAMRVMKELILREKIESNYSTCVLVDDYNPTEIHLDVAQYFSRIESEGGKVDFWAYESDLTQYVSRLFNWLPENHQEKFHRRIEKTQKVPCAVLTAIWYLMRLGHIEDTGHVLHTSSGVEFIAPSLINVLPQRFEASENRTHELLMNLEIKEQITNRIRNIYF